jgi:hypothetical protein
VIGGFSCASRITQIVLAVSDDDRITGFAKRKPALRRQVAVAGDEALALFAADELSKVRSVGGSRRELRTRRLEHYQRSPAVLEERPDSPLITQLRHELHMLGGDHQALARARCVSSSVPTPHLRGEVIATGDRALPGAQIIARGW